MYRVVLHFLSLMMFFSCCCEKPLLYNNTKIVNVFPNKNFCYIIQKDIDLQGGVAIIPEGCELVFEQGVIKNGILVGDNTKIYDVKTSFDKVEIRGTWDVPTISTSMFRDLSYDNSLRDVVALTSSETLNTVYIDQGNFWVVAGENDIAGLSLKSNTKVVLNGCVRLRPNNMPRSYVFFVHNCQDVKIEGTGHIIGDKSRHKGHTGEWGMGIYVKESSNVKINGINVSNCWGDCITIAPGTENVLIEGCSLFKARRQGISICGGSNVIVRGCNITHIFGTPPGYAVDVEPDAHGQSSDILIDNITVFNCNGGVLAYGGAKDAIVSNIEIRNCTVDGLQGKQPAFLLQHVSDCTIDGCRATNINYDCIRTDYAKTISITNCSLDSGRGDRAIRCISSEKVTITHNDITSPTIAINDLSDAIISDNVIRAKMIVNSERTKANNVVLERNIVVSNK